MKTDRSLSGKDSLECGDVEMALSVKLVREDRWSRMCAKAFVIISADPHEQAVFTFSWEILKGSKGQGLLCYWWTAVTSCCGTDGW